MKYIWALIPFLLSMVAATPPGNDWQNTPVVIDGVFGATEWIAADKKFEIKNAGAFANPGSGADFVVGDLYVRYKCNTSIVCIAVRMRDGYTFSGAPNDDETFVTHNGLGNGKITPLTAASFPSGKGWEGCFNRGSYTNFNVFGKFCTVGVAGSCDQSMRIAANSVALPIQCSTTGGGDPHFTTWDGTYYAFHGACDLVMAQNPSFADGLGLDIHIRTEIAKDWSRISNIALRVGESILEVRKDGSNYFNGKHGSIDDAPADLSGFPLYSEKKCTSTDSDSNKCKTWKHTYIVEVGRDRQIEIYVFKGFLNIKVLTPLEGFVGMMGTYGKIGMVARDGVTVFEDPNQMGAEWQVRDTEPMLFHEIKGPQYPEKCNVPEQNAAKAMAHMLQGARAIPKDMRTNTNRHLREGRSLWAEAEKACAGATNKVACVADVVATEDIEMALIYVD